MVQAIGAARGKRIRLWKLLNPLVSLAARMPGRIGGMANKAFGSLTVDQELSVRDFDGYRIVGLEESIKRTEGKKKETQCFAAFGADRHLSVQRKNTGQFSLLQPGKPWRSCCRSGL